MKFNGLGVALITPFNSSDEIDVPALENIVRHIVANGAAYIVILGTTAETVNLSIAEKTLVINTVRKINNNRINLVLGIGGYNTSHVVKEINEMDLTGISAILSVCPYYNKPSQEGIYHHFKTVASNSPLPVILYNVPGRTGTNMEASTTLRLAKDFSNIMGIKEASGNIPQIMNIIRNKPGDFSVISGDDIYTLPLMSLGACGVISVIGNAFPSEFSAMIKAIVDNDLKKAQKIHYQLQDFIHLVFLEGSPSGIKGLMNLLGFCSKKVRLPLWELSEETTLMMKNLVEAKNKERS